MSLPTMALVAMTWLIHQTGGEFDSSFTQVMHTYKVLDTVERAQAHIIDAEANQRGYLLTSRTDYRAPYDDAMVSLTDDLQQLRKLTKDNFVQQRNLTDLENVVTNRLDLSRQVALVEKSNTPAVLLSQQGQETVTRLRHILFDMRDQEQQLLSKRQHDAEQNVITGQIMSFILIGAVAVALIFIVFILLRVEKLQEYVTVCAWTGQVFHEGKWFRLDEYLKQQFGLSVSHSISGEAAEKMRKEIRELNKTPREQAQSTPPETV